MQKRGIFVLAIIVSVGMCSSVAAIDKYERAKEAKGVTSKGFAPNPNLFDWNTSSDSTWPSFYGEQRTGAINASFDCFGRIGKRFSGFSGCGPCVSFESPPGSRVEHLYSGAIWIGGIIGNDTLVSVGDDGWLDNVEFFPHNHQPAVRKINYPTDFSMRALFDDDTADSWASNDWDSRPHIPLNVRVSNRSHAFYSSPMNKTIIYDMVITNIGSQLIEKGFAGFYFDADICHISNCGPPNYGYADDLSGSLPGDAIAYVIDNDGDPVDSQFNSQSSSRLFAMKILSSSFDASVTNFNWWVSNSAASYDFGPRRIDTTFRDFGTGGTGTPMGDGNKYHMLSFPEWDYDQVFTSTIDSTDSIWQYPDQTLASSISRGADTKFLLSVGPFDLHPDSSVRIQFATFTAENVHNLPLNFEVNMNLFYQPAAFINYLDFSDVFQSASMSGFLADSLMKPQLPAIGSEVLDQEVNPLLVQWDPWVYDDVTGYDVYLSEIPPAMLPYPGLVAPWLTPSTLNWFGSTGKQTEFDFGSAIELNKFYFANVAHRTVDGTGEAGEPVVMVRRMYFTAPKVPRPYVYALPGQPVRIRWEEVSGEDIDHYNIYRVDMVHPHPRPYHQFYNEGWGTYFAPPKDSFWVDDRYHYYYAMDVHARLDSGITSFVDYASDGDLYAVMAVNKAGFESDFTVVEAAFTELPTKDILVMSGSFVQFVATDYVGAFYDSVLGSMGPAYDYDSYFFGKPGASLGSIDFQIMAQYKLVILDDDLTDYVWADPTPHVSELIAKYLWHGGKLAYFGGFSGSYGQGLNSDSSHVANSHPSIAPFFAVDTIFYSGLGHFILGSPPPFFDTIFGLVRAEDQTGYMPDLLYDSLRYPFGSDIILPMFWPDNTAPAPVTFTPSIDAEVLHRFRSSAPATSVMEGEAIGIKTDRDVFETYLFGFHLWYMQHQGARQLIEALLPPSACCVNRGDVNHSGGTVPVDISDLTYFADWMFRGGPSPICMEEANVNGLDIVDIADLVYLVDFMFRGGPAPPPCTE